MSASEVKHSKHLVALLASISILGPFATDTYLPSLFDISHTFGVSNVITQQTLTAYIVPFALMTLFHGALSDSVGRRRVMLIALAGFVIASLGCALAMNISMLMIFRALQGITAGAGIVVGRAMVRDLYDGVAAQKFMAQMAMVFALGPAIGPVIGGWLDTWWGWRSTFVFLIIFGLGMFFWAKRALPETLPKNTRTPFQFRSILKGYIEVFGNIKFVMLALALTLGFCAAFTYIIASPAFLTGLLGIPNTNYFVFFGSMTACTVAGTLLANYLASRTGRFQILAVAAAIMTTAAGANLIFHLLHAPCLPWSILLVTLFFFGSAIAMPNLTLMGIDLFPKRRGTAASCQSFCQNIGNAVSTALIAPMVWHSALSMAMSMAVLFGLAALFFVVYLLTPTPSQ